MSCSKLRKDMCLKDSSCVWDKRCKKTAAVKKKKTGTCSGQKKTVCATIPNCVWDKRCKTKAEKVDRVNALPNDILRLIAAKLDPVNAARFRATNKKLMATIDPVQHPHQEFYDTLHEAATALADQKGKTTWKLNVERTFTIDGHYRNITYYGHFIVSCEKSKYTVSYSFYNFNDKNGMRSNLLKVESSGKKLDTVMKAFVNKKADFDKVRAYLQGHQLPGAPIKDALMALGVLRIGKKVALVKPKLTVTAPPAMSPPSIPAAIEAKLIKFVRM